MLTFWNILAVILIMLVSSLLTATFIVGGIMYVVEEIEKRKSGK